MAAIVDLPDGSFTLLPDPKRVSSVRLILVASTVLLFGAGLGVMVLGPSTRQIPLPVLIIIAVTFIGTEFFLWNAIKPPYLKADAMEISCVSPISRMRMPRSNLGFIFRGQVLGVGRYANVWGKVYIFAHPDGKIGFQSPSIGFIDDGVAEFAQRLEVPIRGDFSAQVKDRIDPTSP
jgi:hypothetical protein